jgi:hypothetical protein
LLTEQRVGAENVCPATAQDAKNGEVECEGHDCENFRAAQAAREKLHAAS